MVIAFIGKKRSGKTTACEYLTTDNTLRVNFKDALLREVRQKFPKLLQEIITIMDATAYDGMRPWTVDRLLAEKPPLARALLQNYGTDVVRAIDSDHFVKEWEATVAKYPDHLILTDDVRFPNEHAAVKRRGGVTIKIVREGWESTDTHISEIEMDALVPDYTITAGTVDELHARLNDVMKNIRA